MIKMNIHDFYHDDLNKEFDESHSEEELRRMYGDKVDILWEQAQKNENQMIQDAWKNNHNLYRVFVTKGDKLGVYVFEGDNNKDVRILLFMHGIFENDIVDVKIYEVRKGKTFTFINK